MDATPTFSIIIPFYNTEEAYYGKMISCIASIPRGIAEAVIVDDGSDRNLSGCFEAAIADAGIEYQFLRKENGGQNSARQYGIEAARGKYVMFLDSDDYLETEAVVELADYLKDSNPALVAFGHDVVTPEGKALVTYAPWGEGFNSISLQRLALNSDSLCRQCYCLQRLKDLPFGLVQGIRIGEDSSSALSWNLELGEGVSFGRTLYHYVSRPSSITHRPPKETLLDVLTALDEVVDRCGPDYAGCRDEVEWMAILHGPFWGGIRIVNAVGPEVALKRRVFSWIDARFPNWRSNPYLNREAIAKTPDFRLLTHGHWTAFRLLTNCRSMKAKVFRDWKSNG